MADPMWLTINKLKIYTRYTLENYRWLQNYKLKIVFYLRFY